MPGQKVIKVTKRSAKKATLPSVKRLVKRELGKRIERNYYDRTLINTTVDDNTGTFYSMHPTGVGTNDLSRLGDNIFPLGLQIKGLVGVADTSNMVRVLVVQYMDDANTSSPNIDKILASTYKGGIGYPLAPYSHGNHNKAFRILGDKTMLVDTYRPFKRFSFKIPGKKLHKLWYSVGGTTPIKGGLYVVAVSDSSAVAHPSLLATCRLWFNP